MSSQDKLETPWRALLALCSAKIWEAKSEPPEPLESVEDGAEEDEVLVAVSVEDELAGWSACFCWYSATVEEDASGASVLLT